MNQTQKNRLRALESKILPDVSSYLPGFTVAESRLIYAVRAEKLTPIQLGDRLLSKLCAFMAKKLYEGLGTGGDGDEFVSLFCSVAMRDPDVAAYLRETGRARSKKGLRPPTIQKK